MRSNEAENCKSCRFFLLLDKTDKSGICRRRSPWRTSFEEPSGVWPWTRDDNWCGDHDRVNRDNSQDFKARLSELANKLEDADVRFRSLRGQLDAEQGP